MSTLKTLSLLIIVLTLLSLASCKDAWTRGQPPSVATILERSSNRLDSAIVSHAGNRDDIAELARQIRTNLQASINTIKNGDTKGELIGYLKQSRNGFISLEEKLSIGSRAAYGELAGQLRVFEKLALGNKDVTYPAFGLFASRALFFLANELSVPAPV